MVIDEAKFQSSSQYNPYLPHKVKTSSLLDAINSLPSLQTCIENRKMVRGSIFLAFVVGVFLLGSPAVEGLSCMDISPAVMQCAPFALGAVSQPSNGCCSEVNRLSAMASTGDDRRQLCYCLKQVGPQFPAVRDYNLLEIPRRCGVSRSFGVSRNTDCSK